MGCILRFVSSFVFLLFAKNGFFSSLTQTSQLIRLLLKDRYDEPERGGVNVSR
jgi:hypothetical protein